MGAKDHIDRRHVMPIITPVFPAQNATANVSKSTLIVMKEEFERGKQICERIKQGNAGAGCFEGGREAVKESCGREGGRE